jgi:hypothetical protein
MPEMPPDELALGITGYILTVALPEIEQKAGSIPEIQQITNEVLMTYVAVTEGQVPAEIVVSKLRQIYHNKIAPLRKRYGLEVEELGTAPLPARAGSGLTKAKPPR